MKMHHDIDSIIFDYLADELNSENKKRFEALSTNSPELKDYIDKVRKEWNGEKNDNYTYSVDKAFENFQNRINPSISLYKNYKTYFNIAASVAIVFAVAFGAYLFGLKSNDSGSTIVTCGVGERASVFLPDGSLVTLNSQSSISYNSLFLKGNRNIHLEGEASFKVKSDKKHPFTVMAQGLDIVATGTEFNVMAYPNDPIVRTALIEGILNIAVAELSKSMQAGDVVSYVKTSCDLLKNNDINANNLMAWKHSELVFENELLQLVVNQIERFYGVEVVLDPGIANKRFSGVVHNESIDELLIILKNTLGIDVKKKNELIYLSQRKRSS